MTTIEWAKKHEDKARRRHLKEKTEETKKNLDRWETVVAALWCLKEVEERGINSEQDSY